MGGIGKAPAECDAGNGGGIVVGGDFTIGTTTAAGTSTANITFSNAMSLGASSRTITVGSAGTYTFNGNISGDDGVGLTISSGSSGTGTVILGGTNAYSGPTVFNNTNVVLNGSIAGTSALTLSLGLGT